MSTPFRPRRRFGRRGVPIAQGRQRRAQGRAGAAAVLAQDDDFRGVPRQGSDDPVQPAPSTVADVPGQHAERPFP